MPPTSLTVQWLRCSLSGSPLLGLPIPPTGRTHASVTMRQWAEALRAECPPGADSTDRLLAATRAGMAEADPRRLLEWEGSIEATASTFHMERNLLAAGLLKTFDRIELALPDLSVRAAVGWRMITQHAWPEWWSEGMPLSLAAWLTGSEQAEPTRDLLRVSTRLTRMLRDRGDAEDADTMRVVTALAERGWLFAAAGVSRAEAEDLTRTGALDWGDLQTMTALRGVPMPVTA